MGELLLQDIQPLVTYAASSINIESMRLEA